MAPKTAARDTTSVCRAETADAQKSPMAPRGTGCISVLGTRLAAVGMWYAIAATRDVVRPRS